MLDTYVGNICSVQSYDSVHAYPYGCRTYSPGESRYARKEICNSTMINPFNQSDILITATNDSEEQYYSCPSAIKIYTSCSFNRYLYNPLYQDDDTNKYGFANIMQNKYATECRICPTNATCLGGTNAPRDETSELYEKCGQYYIGSIYQQMVIYALQNCMRPSNESFVLPESILADVDTSMKKMRVSLVKALSDECESYSGTWVDVPWIDEDSNGYHDKTGDVLFYDFYVATGANKLWGYCKAPTQ